MRCLKGLLLLFIITQFLNCTDSKKQASKTTAGPLPKSSVMQQVSNLYATGKYRSAISFGTGKLAMKPGALSLREIAYINLLLGYAYDAIHYNDSALYYYGRAEVQAGRINQTTYHIDAQIRMTNLYYTIGQPDSVLRNREKLAAESDTLKDMPLKMRALGVLAGMYFNADQFEKALKMYFQILKYTKEKKDSLSMGTAMINISLVYEKFADYKTAETYLLQGIPLIKSDPRNSMISYKNLGIFYNDTKQYNKALGAFQKSVDLAKQYKDTVNMQDTYLPMITSFTALKQFDKAKQYLTSSMVYYNKAKNDVNLLHILMELGAMEVNGFNYQKAIAYYEKALVIQRKTGHLDYEYNAYAALADAAAKAGMYQKAYQYQLKYDKIKDSLAIVNTKKTVADLEIKYQTGQKEQKILLLNQQARLKDVELKSQQRQWWFLVAAVCFLLVIAFLLYRSYSLKKNSNELLEEKNRALNELNNQLNEANSSKTKLFSILSHDLRAPVGSLFQFLSIQKNHAGKLNTDQQEKHNTRIINSAENLMESMEDLLIWSKSQMESFSITPTGVTAHELIDYAIKIHRDFAEEKQITLSYDNKEDVFLMTDVNFLKIILRNIVSNAIKFTPKGGSIKVTAKARETIVEFRVSDNGPGITKEQIDNIFEWNSIRSDSSGLGLKLAKEFIDRLKGSIAVESELNEGTTFIVLVPAQPLWQDVTTTP
ncbi:MAG: HAMP domain-containing histidine kinase [Bacteroidota bacterium]|nr:HAMP domain-containing histidine kinase [Bacteroidota bacterium]